MILLSNHLLTLPQFENLSLDVVIRINLSYVKDEAELERFLAIPNYVFMDYPKDRTKPPAPTLSYQTSLNIAKQHDNVRFFAVSNIESIEDIEEYKMPERIRLVPKIETVKGVENLDKILDCDIKHIMLDAEDLYTDCDNKDIFLEAKEYVKCICEERDIQLLELYGVVFSDL